MAVLSIIADDLTGACDTGAGFARAGLRVLVALAVDMLHGRDAPLVDGDVIVYNTESRYLPVAQATNAVIRAAHNITDRLKPRPPESPISTLQSQVSNRIKPRPPIGDAWVYKKIDSTLRGHPGEELAALMGALNVVCALVAPAFPAQGRATIDAQVRVNGQPLAQTPFVAEAGSGDLRAVFGGQGYPVHAIGLADVRQGNARLAQRLGELRGIIIADAETDADLAGLATAAQSCGVRVLCGSAGLAQALSQLLYAGVPRTEIVQPCGPVLVIAGSRNPVTLRQIEVALEYGVCVIPVPTEPACDETTEAERAGRIGRAEASPAPTDAAHRAAETISAGCAVIVTTAGSPESPLGKDVIADRLGAVAAAVLARVTPGAVVLTGGDIATAVCAALGAQSLELCGELQPGIAFGRLADGPYAGLQVITKAGGFGRAESLWEIIGEIRE